MRRQTPHPLPGNFLSLLAKGFELLDLGVFRVAARVTCQTKRRGRPASREIFLRPLVATGAGDLLRDMSFVRKLDGLLNRRHAPIDPVPKGQRGDHNCKD